MSVKTKTMNLIDKILSRLRNEDKRVSLKLQRQEGDWFTLQFYINYNQRCALIDSIENKAEIPVEFLYELAEAIRNGELNKVSTLEEERAYYQRMFDLIKPEK